jgi:hypothetical protein
MVKTYKELINEMHEPLNEGIPNRAASSFIGGVAGGIAGGVLGGLGGAALETLGGIPGAAKVGLTGGISVGGASGLRAGLISGIKDDAEMARYEYETAAIHGWGRDHLDRFYKKYKDLVDTHNSLVMFKKNRMELDPMFHEPLNELHMVPETPEDKYQEHLRSTEEAYNSAIREHHQTVKDHEEPLKAAGNHGETKTEYNILKNRRGETRHFIKTIITDKSGRVVLHKITQKPMPIPRKEFMKHFDTRPIITM